MPIEVPMVGVVLAFISLLQGIFDERVLLRNFAIRLLMSMIAMACQGHNTVRRGCRDWLGKHGTEGYPKTRSGERYRTDQITHSLSPDLLSTRTSLGVYA